MNTRQLKCNNGQIYTLNLDTPELIEHFNNPRCCTISILNQINNNYYNRFIDITDNIILDLGANIGLVSIYMSSYANKIISIEPTPSHLIC